MRAKEFITEVFQPGKTNWEWLRRGSEEANAQFKVGDREYRWDAFTQRANPKKWEIQFRLIRTLDDDPDMDLFGQTGTGNSTEVLSVAVDIIRAFLEYYGLDRVEEITFNAKEDKRIGLYAKMIKRLLPNWDLYSRKDPENGMQFTLTDRRAYDKPENKLSEDKKIARYNGLIMGYVFNDAGLKIKAYDPETRTPIAFAEFNKEDKELYPRMIWVHDDYRNKGIAKSMYDFLKNDDYVINRSHDQTNAGTKFWDKHRGEDAYVWEEEVLDEMPLPADWDPSSMRQQATTFKSRLAYALERAKKLGTGSSRVATVIEYEGRPTVLKIAKNQKGLAQNSVEADILSDGYASQIGILIPIIDYDEQNREPSWVHTELAQKANEKQICYLMKCDSLMQMVRFANTIAGKYRGQSAQSFIENMINDGKRDEDIEVMTEYANKLADLANSFDVELADFARPANWGIYQGHPVVVDVGFNSNVMNQYYK